MVLNFLFLGRDLGSCPKAADTNDDGKINVADAIFLIDFLFRGGDKPGRPYPDCGPDPTADDLDCAVYAPGGFSLDYSMVVSWVVPTKNEDDSDLDDLAGFYIYYGPVSRFSPGFRVYAGSREVLGRVKELALDCLPERDLYFTVTAFDTSGNESGYSNEFFKPYEP